MKKALSLLAVLGLFFAGIPQTALAAVQNVNGAGNVAIDADGQADGVSMTAQSTNESTLTVGDNVNINANDNAAGVATDANAKGSISFAGTSNVKGTVGTTNLRLNGITTAGAAETVTFEKDVFATVGSINNTSTIAFQGHSTFSYIDFQGDGTISMADGKNYTGNVTTAGNNQGTFTLLGSSTVTGALGSSTALDLKTINAGANGSTSTFTSTIFAQDFKITGTGTVALQGDTTAAIDFDGNGILTLSSGTDVTGTIVNSTDGFGTVTFLGTSTTGGNIGVATTGDLLAVNVQGGVVTLGHDIAAITNLVNSGGTLSLSGARTITGNLEIDDTGTDGILTLDTNALTVTGTFTMDAGTTLNMTANSATAFGTVTSTGASTIDAASTVNVTVGGYIPNGSTLAVITGGGAGATSPLVTDNSAVLSFTASTTAGDTVLTASRSNLGTTSNSTSVGTVINAVSNPTGDMTNVIGALDSLTTASQVSAALEQMDPIANDGNAATSFTVAALHHDAVTGHLSDTRSGVSTGDQTGVSTGEGWNENGIWVKGIGNHSEQDNRGGFNGYDADTWGVSGGSDALVAEGTRLGFAGGYAASDVENQGDTGGTDIDTYQGSVYVGFDMKPWYVNTAFTFSWNSYESTRSIVFPGVSRVAESETDGQQYTAIVDTGYVIQHEQWEITPLASLEYSHLNIDGYTETGAGALNLIVDDQSYDFLELGLGGKLALPIKDDNGTWVPEVHARWLYDMIGDNFQTTSSFAGGGSAFSTNGLEPAQHALNAGAGIMIYTKGNVTLSGVYDFTYKEDFTSHNAEAVLRYNF